VLTPDVSIARGGREIKRGANLLTGEMGSYLSEFERELPYVDFARLPHPAEFTDAPARRRTRSVPTIVQDRQKIYTFYKEGAHLQAPWYRRLLGGLQAAS